MTILANWLEIVAILVHYQPCYEKSHIMKPSDPPLGSLRVTILLVSPVQMLVHCVVVKYSRPPDIKSSSNVSLPFAWIKGPATDPSFSRVHIFFLLDTSTLRISFFLDEKDASQETKLVHKSSFSFGPPGLRSIVQL